jgi:glucose-1-phosphate cytidylyltransferase
MVLEREKMKVVILAGGLGSRLAEETLARPKPMVEIGGYPILWHIMNIYATYGFKDFVVACGYKSECIKDYFCNYRLRQSDVSVDLRSGDVEIRNGRGPDWRVTLAETGMNTQTGGRIKRCKPWLDDETFMVTYGDGVGNINIGALVEFHRRHGRLATLTAVRPPARFGGLIFDGDRITEFSEKPQVGEGWINGGFMVFEPRVLSYIAGDETPLEREPIERLAADGQLMAYRHEEFWQPMDTLREKELLESLWRSGKAPWKVWTNPVAPGIEEVRGPRTMKSGTVTHV